MDPPAKTDNDLVEYQEFQGRTESAFVYEDPRDAGTKSLLERRLLLKADILIIGMTSLVFLVNQWDRGNIGNARVMGFQKDIHMSNGQFYDAVSFYYLPSPVTHQLHRSFVEIIGGLPYTRRRSPDIGYVICILPANLMIRFFKAHRQIGGCVILFATLSCSVAAAKNAGTVLALRIIFGFVSTFLQALSLYTSMWYKRNEMATRSGIFYSAATIAGGFSGLIAYAIQKNLDGALGKHAWQWLFIIQGVAGLVVGIAAWILLPPPPDQMKGRKHWIFSQEEIELAITRLKTYNVEGAGFQWKQLQFAFKDPKTIMFSLMNAGISLGLASISAFLPTFILQFGFSPVRTQLFSIIPYACAFVTLLMLNYISDRVNVKGPFLMFCLSISSIGYIILLACHNVKVKIFATCLITAGVFPCVTLLGAWTIINTGGFTKRAATWGVAEIFGQCFSILGSHIYTDPPQFVKGHSILLAFQLLALASAVVCWFWMRRLNRLRDEEMRRHREAGTTHPDQYKSLEQLHDHHPVFRYVL